MENLSKTRVRPYIICHMLSSVDGKIDGASLKGLTADGEYEATGAQLDGDAWICGRTTMQQHFADPEPFIPSSRTSADPQPCMSLGVPSPTLLQLTRSGSFDGQAMTSTVTTLFAWFPSKLRQITLRCCSEQAFPMLFRARARLILSRPFTCFPSTSVSADCCSKAAATSMELFSKLGSSTKLVSSSRLGSMDVTRLLLCSMA